MEITLRAPHEEDLASILELLEARERADFLPGSEWQELVLQEWNSEAFDRERSAIVAAGAGGSVAGFAALLSGGGFVAVDPRHEGRGVGTRLLVWLEGCARSAGRGQHRQLIAAGNGRAAELLHAAGYRHVRSYLQLARDLADPLPDPPTPPEGLTLHRLEPEADGAALHALDAAAFSENPDYEPETLESFWHEHLAPDYVDREVSLLARRGADVVGMALCRCRRRDANCHLDLLAVAPGQRRQGLGRTLLLHVFAKARQRRFSAVTLGVASDNPTARHLYEQAGMEERYRGDVLEKPMAPPAPAAHRQ